LTKYSKYISLEYEIVKTGVNVVKDNKSILLVEDEFLIAMGKQQELEKYGYTVQHVNTGEKAVEMSKENIDLILMDIDLGKGIDGTDAAEFILKERDIPVVFLSSHMDPEVVEKTERITSYGYVVKSSSITVLDASIKMAFKLFDAQKKINQQNMKIKVGNENLRVTIEELETGRKRLNSIFRAAPTGIGVVKDRILIEINQKICEITGYKEEELIGKSSKILYPTQEEFDFVGKEKYEQIKLKGTGTVETRWKCKDGKIIDVLLSSTPLDINNLEKGVTFTALNITERKNAELALSENKELLNSILKSIKDPIFIIDIDKKFTAYHNTSDTELYLPPDNYIGKNILEVLPEDVARDANNAMTKVLETGELQKFDYSIIINNKSKYYESNISPMFDDSGNIFAFVSANRDITERIEKEKILLKRDSLLTAFITALPDISLIFDEDGKYIEVLSAIDSLLYAREDELVGKYVDDILPKTVATEFHKIIRKTIKTGEPQKIEYSLTLQSGKTWFQARIASMTEKIDGKKTVVWLAHDITESKHVEDELKESEARFKALHNASFGGIAIHNKGLILDCNQGLSEISGYTINDLIGMDGLLLIAEESREMVMGNILAKYEKPYEAIGIKQNGDKYPLQLEARMIPYKGKQVRVVEFRDITENKLIKDALIKSEILLKSSIESPSDMIILSIDKEYRYLYFNQNHKDDMLSAYNNVVEIGMNLLDCISSDIDKKNAKINYDKALAGKSHSTIQEYGDIKRLYYETRYNPIIDGDGSIIGATAFAFDITKRKQLEDKVKQQLLEKEIILKETHHRIKNNFASIGSLLSLQVNSSDNPEVQSALHTAIGRVKGLSVLYEKLLLSDNYHVTSVKEYLNNLIDDIINLLSNEQNLTITKQIDDIKLDSKHLFPIGLFVNELLTNVLKYAFINKDSGLIEIILKQEGEEITLTIKDNGNGLPDGFDKDKQKGFGFALIKMLSEQLDGSFTIDNHLGTKSTIKFPI